MINLDSPNFTHLQPSGSKRKQDDSSAPLSEKRYRAMSPEFPNCDRILKISSMIGNYISSKFLTEDEKKELAILTLQRGGFVPEQRRTLQENFLFLPHFAGRTKRFCVEVLNAQQFIPYYDDLTLSEKQTLDRKIRELCQKVEQGRNNAHELRIQEISATARVWAESMQNPAPTLEVDTNLLEDRELHPENTERQRALETANIRMDPASAQIEEFRRTVQEYRKASTAFDKQREQLTFAYSVQFEKMEDPTWTWSSDDTITLNYIEDRLFEYAGVMNSLAEEEDSVSSQPCMLPILDEYLKANALYDAAKADFDQRVRELEGSTDLTAIREMKTQLNLVVGILRSANPRCFR